jgi:hypothetical protein
MSRQPSIKGLRRTVDEFRTRFARKRSRSAISGSQRDLVRPGTPPDEASARAKSSVHRKTTADKWNQ